MTMLSQRSVDYAIKAYELSNIEICRLASTTESDLRELQLHIGNRGRTLNAAGASLDTESISACCALRVYSALQVTYTTATEIAQCTSLLLESGDVTESSFSTWKEAGRFVNGLVGLYTVALFKKEIQHAKVILDSRDRRKWFERALKLTRDAIIRGAGSNAKFEVSIVHCLGQIAEQAYEIADATALWLEGHDCLEIAQESAA
jgi:hypothetical protein